MRKTNIFSRITIFWQKLNKVFASCLPWEIVQKCLQCYNFYYTRVSLPFARSVASSTSIFTLLKTADSCNFPSKQGSKICRQKSLKKSILHSSTLTVYTYTIPNTAQWAQIDDEIVEGTASKCVYYVHLKSLKESL